MGSNRRTISAAVATVLVSVALYPIFTGGAWFWAGMGATITVALAGTLTRLRRLPVVVCLIGGVGGLLLYLNLVFAHSQSLLLVIPTPSSLDRLWHLAGQGVSQSAGYAPPVPELAGMVLLATGGIGLTALFTDLISVRLHSAALAGLPLLLLFTEPFTLSVSRGWLGTTAVFCLAAAGYLTMLASEGRERIREWEQPRPGQQPGRPAGKVPDISALTAAGRRVGIASVIAALCVPMFVPGLHATRLFGNGSPGIGGEAGGGLGAVGFPDIQTAVTRELRESRAQTVLKYTTTAATPGYLQVEVLDNLTATGWQPFSQPESLAPVTPRLPAPPGLTDTAVTSPVTTDITVAKNVAADSLSALAAPYPAITVQAPEGTLRADRATLMIFDNGARLGGLSYSVRSADIQPGEQSLASAAAPPAAIRSRYLEVPSSYKALRGLAENVVAGAKTPYAEAVALQDWFADGNFTYSLSSPTITNEAGLENFLETTHTGYCQQFAFAMAALARLLGIPSRVAYGFTQGTHVSGSKWVVTTHDAHAWPELYFQGFGWLRFEPTPGGPTGQGTATTPAYTQQQTGPSIQSSAPAVQSTAPSSGGTGTSGSQSSLNRAKFLGLGEAGSQTTSTPAPGGASPWALAGLSLLGLLALIIIVPGCVRAVIRRRRWRAGIRAGDAGLANAAWLELRDDLTDYGAGYHPSETPRALAARIAETVRADAALDAVGTTTLVATAGLAGPDLIGSADLAETIDLIGRPDVAGAAEAAQSGAAGADPGTALRRVAMAAERARYSAEPAPGDTLRHDSAVIRRAIAASASRRARWQARIFPSSVVAPVVIAFSQVTDAFGRLNAFGRLDLSRGGIRSRGRISRSAGARISRSAGARIRGRNPQRPS